LSADDCLAGRMANLQSDRLFIALTRPHEQLIRQDRLGSVILMSADRTTATVNVNTYDEYGVPGSGNTGRFQYTGQVWLPQIGLYHYKARTYSPTLGRFLQTDPIGYGDGLNMYAYVGNDPINAIDPLGLNEVKPKNPDGSCDEGWFETTDDQCGRVIITADRYDDTYAVGPEDGLVAEGDGPSGGDNRPRQKPECYSAREGGSASTGCRKKPLTKKEICQSLVNTMNSAGIWTYGLTLSGAGAGAAEQKTSGATKVAARISARAFLFADLVLGGMCIMAMRDYNIMKCDEVL